MKLNEKKLLFISTILFGPIAAKAEKLPLLNKNFKPKDSFKIFSNEIKSLDRKIASVYEQLKFSNLDNNNYFETYKIQKSDTLSEIIFEKYFRYVEISRYTDIIGIILQKNKMIKNPNLIIAGKNLILPKVEAILENKIVNYRKMASIQIKKDHPEYMVRPGDSFSIIALKTFGKIYRDYEGKNAIEFLLEMNPQITNIHQIKVGQYINLPTVIEIEKFKEEKLANYKNENKKRVKVSNIYNFKKKTPTEIARFYNIKPGDTFNNIVKKLSRDNSNRLKALSKLILSMNPEIDSADMIYAGKQLLIPNEKQITAYVNDLKLRIPASN